MIHALTVDVEDYYNILGRDWLGMEAAPTEAVVRNTSRILELFHQFEVKATFFVLGEVAETYPKLVRDIAADGHELGVHGYYHRQFFKLAPNQVHQEVGNAKKIIEDTIGMEVDGHRAPAFSIREDSQWALEMLVELGFRYDSSIHPVGGRRYGWEGFSEDIHEMMLPSGAKIIEVPMSVVRVFGKMFPACGGGYTRHFPYAYTRWAMRRIQRKRPANVYLHPYEIDTDPCSDEYARALAKADRKTRRVHAIQLRNRKTVLPKLTRLLREFRFAPIREVIASVLSD